jgi:hypothetical protein
MLSGSFLEKEKRIMLKKTTTYTDYNGVERTEDVYFNLSKAELTEMELEIEGGFNAYLQRIVSGQNMPEIIKTLKAIILKAYGEKSPDGKRFIKSKELSESFAQTEAYSQLFMELVSDAEAGAKFINGILPADIAKQVTQQENKIPMMPA